MDEKLLVAIQDAATTIATPNWADTLSAIASVVAVIAACLIAWKQYGITKKQNEISEQQARIMDQQNKIAVFDKQFELYNITEKCLQFSKALSLSFGFSPGTVTLPNIQLSFLGAFSDIYANPETIESFKNIFYFQETQKIVKKLSQAEFVFSKEVSEDIGGHLVSLANCLSYLICADMFTNIGIPLEMLMMNYCTAAEKIETEGILQKMKNQLRSEGKTA